MVTVQGQRLLAFAGWPDLVRTVSQTERHNWMESSSSDSQDAVDLGKNCGGMEVCRALSSDVRVKQVHVVVSMINLLPRIHLITLHLTQGASSHPKLYHLN